MNRDFMEFNHFVENVRRETGWDVVQYTQYDRSRRLVSECAVAVGPRYRGPALRSSSTADGAVLTHLQWSIDAHPTWYEVYCEGRRFQTSVSTYMADYSSGSDRDSSIHGECNYVCLTPVVVDGVVRGAITAYAPSPFSVGDEESLMRYAREAQALERVADLEARTGAQAAALKAMLSDITRLQDQTAEAIAEHLHGKVQSYLLVAWHQLQQCQELLYDSPQQVRELLAITMDILDTVRDKQIRQLSHSLHPSLIRIALIPTIKQLLRRFSQLLDVRLTIAPELTLWDSAVRGPLTLKVRLVLYRILEESLNNMVRHSSATVVEVSLSLSLASRIELVVTDNGRTWDVDPSTPHLGLLTMLTRIEEVRGELHFPNGQSQNRMVCTIPVFDERSLSNSG